jgi:hypothetical protein
MIKRFLFPGLLFFLTLGNILNFLDRKDSQTTAGKTLVLYDASSGTIPSSSLLSFTDFPMGSASVVFSGDATVLDTTPSGSDTFAGWVSSQATTAGFPILDATAGIQLNFTLQVESESHSRENRSGFSVILLDQDVKGIEIAFWQNEVWVQNDPVTGGLFSHGESAPFSTAGLANYQLTILGDTYTLTANSQPLLSGPVRDYSSFEGFPDPYETPNFLFLGDDTTSAGSRVRLQSLSITGTEPVPPILTNTVTNTSSPPLAASLTPQPTVTSIAVPSPAPAARIPQLCSSAWLLAAVIVISNRLMKKLRR